MRRQLSPGLAGTVAPGYSQLAEQKESADYPWYKVHLLATNYGERGTRHIGRYQAENVLHAIRFADQSGRPLNTLITLSFVALGIDDDQASAVFRDLKGRVTRWWADQRDRKKRPLGKFVGVHAHANPAGSRHMHWMLSVPPEILPELLGVLRHRLQKVTGIDDLRAAVHAQPVGGAGGLAKYILRGIDPAYGDYLHIRPANEGWVTGFRTGTSRAIGRSSRKAASWQRRPRR